MTGRLVIFSGPSGVGKDTLLDRWAAIDPLVQRVVTYTTRPPREGEAAGVAYHFVSEEDFKRMAAEGAFLEAKQVHGNLYGSPGRETDTLIAEGKIAVLKIDVQGASEVLKQRPDATTVFIAPPSFEELERRMRSRALDTEAVIQTRLQNARWELDQADAYGNRVVNDDLNRAVAELERIVGQGMPTVPSGSNSTWVVPVVAGCGAVVLGFAVIAALLFPVFSQAKLRALQRQTVVNAHRLGAAVLLYAADNNDALPLRLSSAAVARPSIQMYVTDDRAFTTLNPAGSEFLGNPEVSGTRVKAYTQPAQVVLFYESNPWRDGRRAVVWLDGHACMAQGPTTGRELIK